MDVVVAVRGEVIAIEALKFWKSTRFAAAVEGVSVGKNLRRVHRDNAGSGLSKDKLQLIRVEYNLHSRVRDCAPNQNATIEWNVHKGYGEKLVGGWNELLLIVRETVVFGDVVMNVP